ncbi:transcriptional regulator, LysR family [alpha proteobacterium U9-1i]|nr:transcriptional regulator, LysR family [alpha proteobacterium U9-1i]
MYDWDDLRVFLSAERAGSLNAAAVKLGVDAATVGRRLARLETALKATLFARSATGLKLTSAGARLMEIALDAEAAMDAAARVGETDVAGGAVRIGAPEGFGTAILAPALAELHRQRPNLRVELAAQTSVLSATKREVDIAVTLSAPHAARLIVEPLTDYQLGLYATTAYLKRAGAPQEVDDLLEHTMVGYVDDLVPSPELRYLNEIHPDLKVALASSSIRAQEEIVRTHGGIGVLPCFVAKGLTRVLPSQVRLTRRFWLSVHRDVAETARVRAVRTWLRGLVKARRRELLPARERP